MLTQLNSKLLLFFQMKFLFLTSLPVLVLTLLSCSTSETNESISGFAMGTSYSVQWVSSYESIDSEQLQNNIEERLENINQLMSTYDASSQLSEFNQSRETGWHAVDIDLAKLVQLALKICDESDKAFDITVGPLVNLWGFGNSNTKFSLPNETELKITRQNIGCHHLDARQNPPALNKKRADLYVDLSAIAKGYAVDQIATILDGYQIENYLVEIGGELKAKGLAPHGNPWRIGIETPNWSRSEIKEIISLNNVAIATSGDYRNFVEHEGKHYSHVIDPRTGVPVEHGLTSVTVVHASAAIADAWATALLVLGPNQALKLAEQYELAIFMITREPNGIKSTFNKHMEHFIVQ